MPVSQCLKLHKKHVAATSKKMMKRLSTDKQTHPIFRMNNDLRWKAGKHLRRYLSTDEPQVRRISDSIYFC